MQGGLHILIGDEVGELFLISYLIGNGILQLYIVHWILQRNKKLTMLLAEYYQNH